jgi:hypothetical protein
MCGAILPLSNTSCRNAKSSGGYVFMPCYIVKHKDKFTFTFNCTLRPRYRNHEADTYFHCLLKRVPIIMLPAERNTKIRHEVVKVNSYYI